MVQMSQNPTVSGRVYGSARKEGNYVMLQRFASTAFVIGTLFSPLIPAVLAADHGGRGGRGERGGRIGGGQGFSGANRNFAQRGFQGGIRNTGRQIFANPRGFGGNYYGRGFIAPRAYSRPIYPRYYGSGFSLGFGFGAPYSYAPGSAYGPGYGYGSAVPYAAPQAPQNCVEGSYDQSGAWVPNPNCYGGQQDFGPNQQQYQQPPQGRYDPNQQPYPPAQQDYDPNQQSYPQQQQDYDPNQRDYPQGQPDYDPSQSQQQRYNR